MTVLRVMPALQPGAQIVTCWMCHRDHDMASEEVRQDGPRGEWGDWICTDFDACAERAACDDELAQLRGNAR